VNKQILTAAVARIHVLLGGKSAQTIRVHKCSEHWLNLGDEHVDSKIEFTIVDQVGLRLILLNHMTLVPGNVFNATGYKDALTLALILWLYYECGTLTCGLLSLREEGIEIEKFIRSDPGLREELELLRECFLH